MVERDSKKTLVDSDYGKEPRGARLFFYDPKKKIEVSKTPIFRCFSTFLKKVLKNVRICTDFVKVGLVRWSQQKGTHNSGE